MTTTAASPWQPDTWRQRPARQMPTYPDPAPLDAACAQLRQFPPLIFAGEVQALRAQLAEVAAGRAFLLQGGDCAESFDTLDGNAARETFRVMLQMAVVLTYAAARPVVKVGRIAGQYAKPRSADTETQGGVTLPSYRGDIVNGAGFTAAERAPDPARMLRAYSASAATLNLLRALAQGGFADLNQLHAWTTDFVRASPQGQRYAELAERIGESLAFMAAMGFNSSNTPQLREVSFHTSHEALLLPYEEALTRHVDHGLLGSAGGAPGWYATSAHMLWLGERTRQLDGAHIEYLRGIANPVGVKVGPTATPDEVLALLDALDPAREPGRVVLITRMGAGKLAERLPPLLAAVRDAGWPAIWSCDPMHGNTVSTAGGVKTRDFANIVQEVREFFAAHAQAGTVAGGLHVELTGQDVTECRGGGQNLTDERLAERYTTACDPRLNGSQSLELAFLVADLLKAGRRPGGESADKSSPPPAR
ncbi:MAG: 3-deoxy-7-phosphoheptulonate synthase class II [Pseudomonadota bacterium]|nr:3-deoxy-7-phosphoheptulonate synthase class II [Pseudomonadota bacterium]